MKSSGKVTDLQAYYRQRVPELMQQFGYTNVMQAPKLVKVVLNMGVGKAVADKKVLDYAMQDLERIAGQKAIVTKAHKSIAGFKIRAGNPIGCKVTLRRRRMYEFVERLVGITIPRSRDFRGLSPRSFDGHGNFTMGITEQITFPEIDYDKIDELRGLDICVVTSAQTDAEGLALLRLLNFPFRGGG